MVGTVGRCPIPSTIDALRLDLRPGGPFAFEPPTRGGPPGVLRDDGRTRGSGTWFSAEVGFVPRRTSGDRPSGGTNAFPSRGVRTDAPFDTVLSVFRERMPSGSTDGSG